MQNPLEAYRRTQRELRRHFEAFTRENCPTCPTPCCRRPARIAPTDILLAEATGWRAHVTAVQPSTPEASEDPPDSVVEAAGNLAEALCEDDAIAEEEGQPCEFLGAQGCTFPTDLRPYGCTAYLCKYMYERLDRKTLTRVKRLVRELDERHTILLRSTRNVRWRDADEG
jgi:hypothetical protein